MKITCKCLPDLEGSIPEPIPAKLALPDWWDNMNKTASCCGKEEEIPTVKNCLPFFDALTHGVIIPLAADIFVENGDFSWDWSAGDSIEGSLPRDPIGFHESSQLPVFGENDIQRPIIKFNNFWTIETEPGISLLVLHPLNRLDLPFRTLSGLVDSDVYCESVIQFPAIWTDSGFSGTLHKGTPVAQLIPVPREAIDIQIGVMEGDSIDRFVETTNRIATTTKEYLRSFRQKK